MHGKNKWVTRSLASLISFGHLTVHIFAFSPTKQFFSAFQKEKDKLNFFVQVQQVCVGDL